MRCVIVGGHLNQVARDNVRFDRSESANVVRTEPVSSAIVAPAIAEDVIGRTGSNNPNGATRGALATGAVNDTKLICAIFWAHPACSEPELAV